MSQITLRKIPENIERQIRTLSQKNHSSLNQTIIDLLEKALGTERNSGKTRDLSKNSGTWDEKQVREFQKTMKTFEEIDDDIWK